MPQTALIPPLSEELAAPGNFYASGACVCPQATSHHDCRCPWGAMVRELIRIGYVHSRHDAAQALHTITPQIQHTVATQRRRVLALLAAHWPGSATAFQEHYQISKSLFYDLGLRVPLDQRKSS